MRKDGLSSFQAKKQKLQEIKTKIDNYHKYWEEIRKNKLRDYTMAPANDSYNILEQIWEIVKDE